MIRLFLVIALLFTSTFSFSQATTYNVDDLKVSWENTERNYQNTNQSLSVLTFENVGKMPFPASGWSLYFNLTNARIDEKDALKAKIERVNGDLFKIVPLSGFEGIKPGEKQKIQILTAQMKNISRLPLGFYLVWDQNPTKGINIKNSMVRSMVNNERQDMDIAANLYNENKIIEDIPAEKLTKVFPSPVTYQETGDDFILGADVQIISDATFIPEASMLAAELSNLLGKKILVNSGGAAKTIILKKDTISGDENYRLEVSKKEILIRASSPAGAFYGIQSLKTLLPAQAWKGQSKNIRVPGVSVEDGPRFGFRGFMMDVARNFQPKSEVLKVLDVMALYKLNVFHFHFNDDEGWRLEIPGLPELTEVGSQRGHTVDDKNNIVPSWGSGADTGVPSGSGFYSRADFIEILKYARDRHIRVIPEIETPGHARAAIKSMDARYEKMMKAGNLAGAERYLLHDQNDKSVYRSVQGWADNVINVALPSTYNFLEKVVDEIREMYAEAGAPLSTIHFGGDEVPEGVWQKSPAVKSLMESNPEIKNPDDLWYYYFAKVNELLKKRGLYLSGWEEIGLRKTQLDGRKHMLVNSAFVNDNFHVDVWKNSPGSAAEDLPYKMANAGYKVVLTSVTNFYLDMAANKSFEEPGLYWGGYVDTDKPFYFIPFDYYKNMKEDDAGNPLNRAVFKGKERLTEFGKSNIIGLQAPLWSETVKTPERLEYMLLPKLLALAERAWAKDPKWATETDTLIARELYNKAWSEFVNVLGKRELPRLDYYSGGYNYRIPTPGIIFKDGVFEANAQFPGFTIRYSLDGTEPTLKSKLYTDPVQNKGPVIFRLFNANGRGGRAVKALE
ncbi:MAG TPA: family 20 glycosylhydrolase [Daejeonella sp.]|nr:family 20 glycosylhydrolase [Daejeonella sp.]